MSEKLITVQQLCNIVQVSRATIDRWRKEGMPFITIGRGIRFDEKQAMEWIKNKSNRNNNMN